MKRLAAMQLWPQFWKRAVTPTLAACSRSASASTTKASEPPSSSTVFLSAAPAAAAIFRPAASLPVSVTAWMRGSAMSCSACVAGIMSVRNTPAGKPAARKISSIANAHCGTFEECLSTIVLPAMSAGAAARNTCQKGKFHGMTARIVPSGR